MTQKYRLGIDLGTSSIGVAAYSLKENNEIENLIYLDSYIFGEPVSPDKTTTNTQRRNARLLRRQIERKAARLRKIGYIAQSIGITKEETSKISSQKIHELRAKAISQKVTLAEFIKVLFHLAKNRGYSGDLDLADEESDSQEEKSDKKKNNSPIKTAIEDSHKKAQNGSIGCLIYEAKQIVKKGEPWRKLNGTGTYASRDDIKQEFEKLWQEQSKHHSELTGTYKILSPTMFPDYEGKKEISLKEAFYSAIFYQRPIKWKIESVGQCKLEPEYKRAATSQVAYQEFRLADTINNLRIKNISTKQERILTVEEKNKLFNFIEGNSGKYNARNEIELSYIYKELNLSTDEKFTIDKNKGNKEYTKGLKGNSTLFAWEKLGVLNDWSNLSDKAQEFVMEFLANITKYSDVQEQEESVIRDFFNEITVNVKDANDQEKEQAIQYILLLKNKKLFFNKNFVFEQDRASYSVPVLKKLTRELLNKEGAILPNIIKDLYPQKAEEFKGEFRPLQEIQINHPVIDRALAEFKRSMEFIIKKQGCLPEEITVELTRELKNSLARRKYLDNENKIQEKKRTEAIKYLQEHSLSITNYNIEKYLLWIEQDKKCPYCGQEIAVSSDTQVDHIIPRSLGGPNKYENKVLVHTKCNADKKERMPYQWEQLKPYIDDYLQVSENNKKNKTERQSYSRNCYSEFLQRLWTLYNKEKKGYYNARKHKYSPTKYGSVLLGKINNLLATELPKRDFSEQDAASTSYYTTIVLDWCKDICKKVVPGFGPLTHYLRNSLHFEDILPLIRLAENKPLLDRDNKEIDSKLWYELFVNQDAKFLEEGHKTEEWCRIYTRPVREFNYKNAKILKEDFEKYLNEQSDKPNNDEDCQKLFKKFLRDKRKVFSFYKRCDHRHHAVDAAIIGLCTQSLVQRASTHNAKYGGLTEIEDESTGEIKVAGFHIDNMELYSKIKEKTHKYLSNYIVWHKPDHFPSGALFDQTAYNVIEKDGKMRFTIRQSLEKFLGKETKTDSLINKIKTMVVGDAIKEEMIAQIEQNIAKGLNLKEAVLGGPNGGGIYFHGNKVKTIKVMYKEKSLIEFDPNIDKAITTSINGKPRNKYYQNAGYACMIFDEKSGKRTDIIPMWKYKDSLSKQEGKICIFAKDILFSKKDKQFYKVKSFNSQAGLVLVVVTESDGRETRTNNLKDYILVKSRFDLAKIKKEYLKEE